MYPVIGFRLNCRCLACTGIVETCAPHPQPWFGKTESRSMRLRQLLDFSAACTK